MIDANASTRLFNIFSKLVNQSTDPTIDRLANPAATIADAHFADICRTWPNFQEEEYPALLFVLSTLFVKYSSASFLGTEDDSPAALRFYAAALLNKLQTLNENLFNSVEGQRLRKNLFENTCTDNLSIDMRDLAKSNPTIRYLYEQLMPTMWQ